MTVDWKTILVAGGVAIAAYVAYQVVQMLQSGEKKLDNTADSVANAANTAANAANTAANTPANIINALNTVVTNDVSAVWNYFSSSSSSTQAASGNSTGADYGAGAGGDW